MRKNKLIAGVLSAAMVMCSLTLPENINIGGFDFGTLFTLADLDDTEYNAYLIFMTGDYSFRNAWDDSSYGLNSGYDYSVVHSWDGSKAGTFVDAVINGEGTYTVSICGLDLSTSYNTLGISTDIPCDSADITIDNVTIGGEEFDNPDVYIIEDSDYIWLLVINVFDDLEIGDYEATTSQDTSITFTVSKPAVAIVDSGTCGENLTWTLDSDGVLTISGAGEMYDYSTEEIPWYDKAEEIHEVVIEDGVTSIGEQAFYYCYMIRNVDMPESIESIGDYAFCGCNSIMEIEIPENVSIIGEGAFADCVSITSIQIPENVTSIGHDAFVNCSNLTGISVSEDNDVYASYDDIIYSKDMTTLIYSPEGRKETVVISDGVTTIGEYAFEYSRILEGIEMPDSVTTIEDYAFFCCESITQIDISENVTKIGNSAFSYCESVTSIDLPENVSEMGENVFYGCFSLVSVTLPEGITNIGDSTFRSCFCLTDVEIPSTVESIDERAFSYCTSLVSIVIPESVKKIESSAFWECSSLTLYGYSGSTAEIYAGENDIQFIALPDNDQVGNIEADFSDVTLVSGETLSENAEIVMDNVFKGEYFSSEEGLTFLSETVAPLNNGEQNLAGVITDAVNAATSEAFDMSNYELFTNIFDLRVMDGDDVIDGVQNIEVSFDVYNIEDGMQITLLHYDTSEGIWEVYDDLTIDGTNVTVTLSSLSPVALIYIPPISITECDIEIEYDTVQYTGNVLEPRVTIEGLEEGIDYTVSYENNTDVGIATIIVTGVGDYDDTYKTTFEIIKADQIVDTYVLGDANGDDEINYLDAMAVLRYDAELMEMTTVQLAAADVNDDGSVNSLDAILILRYDAGLIASFVE